MRTTSDDRVKPGIELLVSGGNVRSPTAASRHANGRDVARRAAEIPAGARLGLLANQAAILPDGRPGRQALSEAGYRLVRLFGPEHGFRGAAQDAVEVSDTACDGIEVVSLYGERRIPETRHIGDLDAVLVDLQDIGCRYYTYVYTLASILEACTGTGTTVIVCDRPNPINALTTEGGAIPDDLANEVGAFRLAQRHGMTIGEVAVYLQANYFPDAALRVRWMEGYERHMYFPETGLPWKQPSPNLPSPECALVYPGTCLFEGTNLSEGRGTTRPFEIVGAPWIDGRRLRDNLSAAELPGVVFSSAVFVPTFSKFTGLECEGVQVHVTDRNRFKPLRTGVHMLRAARECAPQRFAWRPLWEDQTRSFFDRLAAGEEPRHAVEAGASAADVYDLLCRDGHQFDALRRNVLHEGYSRHGE